MKTIPVIPGLEAIVDQEDYALLARFKWYAEPGSTGHFYARRYRGCKRNKPGKKSKWATIHTRMEHEILPKRAGFVVDHKNRNPLDNRRSNLRYASHSQNRINRFQPNRTGFRGVLERASGRFGSYIDLYYRREYLGTYDTAEEAAAAYNKRAKVLHGEFAQLNILERRLC